MTALTTQLGALAFFATVLMATDAQAQVAKASAAAKSPPPYLVDIAWDAAGQFTVNKSIAAGKFIEVCGKLPAQAKVRCLLRGLQLITYHPSASTPFTSSGIMRLNRFSIPAFSVMVEEGQPLQEPCKLTVTIPSWKE